MFKYRVRLNRKSDVANFVNITSQIPDANIYITDGHSKVSPKSVIFAMAALTWRETECYSDVDIYTKIKDFVPSGSMED